MQTLVPPAFLPKPKGKKVFKLQFIFLHDNKGFCLQYLNKGTIESKRVRINEQCQNKRRNKYKEFKNQIIIIQAHAMFY